MPYFCFTCEDHRDQQAEICCSWSQIPSMTPACMHCEKPMRRDYRAEHFGGIANRSKGIYPFTSENLGDQPVVIGSASEHARILKSRGLAINEPSREGRYRVKHQKDIRR